MVASLGKTMEYLCRHVMPKDQALSKGREKIENDFAVKSEPEQSPLLQSSKYLKFEEYKPKEDMIVYFYSKVVWTIRQGLSLHKVNISFFENPISRTSVRFL
jgi:hypothetical protein